MGLIDELGAYIDSASTRFTAGTNLFGNHMPDEPNTATSIVEYGGGEPDYVLAGDLPLNENQRVQISCRSTSSTRARGNINAAWVAISGIANESLSGKSWLRARPVQSPFVLKRDEQGRVVFAFNADCTRRTTST